MLTRPRLRPHARPPSFSASGVWSLLSSLLRASILSSSPSFFFLAPAIYFLLLLRSLVVLRLPSFPGWVFYQRLPLRPLLHRLLRWSPLATTICFPFYILCVVFASFSSCGPLFFFLLLEQFGVSRFYFPFPLFQVSLFPCLFVVWCSLCLCFT